MVLREGVNSLGAVGKASYAICEIFPGARSLLIFGAKAKADEIRVTAYAVFQQPNAGSNQQFVFSSTFLFDLDTNQLVAGSMSTHVTDTFAGTPNTNWVPKPNFHGPTFAYFDPDLEH